MDENLHQQPEPLHEQDLRHFIRFLHLFHVFYEQPDVASELLCQQVALITRGRIQLMLNVHESTNQADIPVCYRKKQYGIIHINSSVQQASLIQEAQRLAEECGWLLYGLRVATYFQKLLKGITLEQKKSLTEQELTVLTLMEQGKRNHEIALILQIELGTVQAHQRNMYEKLGTHSKHEALLIASMLDLLSQRHIS